MKQATSPRRKFLSNLAAGATALGLLNIPKAIKAAPALLNDTNDADDWFKKITGKHRIVFDVTKPHETMPFAWPKVFLMTNEMTGTSTKDNSVVVILRHEGIPYAFEDRIWSKYNFGEMFKVDDSKTNKPSKKNPFWNPKPGDYQVPGIGNVQIGINELQNDGVMFCVCNVAITVYANIVARNMKTNAEDVIKDWTGGVLPGIQIVPSGVWAVGRAQEHGCAYCFAG